MKFALGANATHGMRRSNADKRKAVEIALKEFRMELERCAPPTAPTSAPTLNETEELESPAPKRRAPFVMPHQTTAAVAIAAPVRSPQA